MPNLRGFTGCYDKPLCEKYRSHNPKVVGSNPAPATTYFSSRNAEFTRFCVDSALFLFSAGSKKVYHKQSRMPSGCVVFPAQPSFFAVFYYHLYNDWQTRGFCIPHCNIEMDFSFCLGGNDGVNMAVILAGRMNFCCEKCGDFWIFRRFLPNPTERSVIFRGLQPLFGGATRLPVQYWAQKTETNHTKGVIPTWKT